jgi:hypothetical protein
MMNYFLPGYASRKNVVVIVPSMASTGEIGRTKTYSISSGKEGDNMRKECIILRSTSYCAPPMSSPMAVHRFLEKC